MQLYILLFEVLFLIGCVKWGIPFWQAKTKKEDITVGFFLNLVAILSGIVILVALFLSAFYDKTDLLTVGSVCSLAITGSFLTTILQSKKKLSFITMIVLCMTGLFLLPADTVLSYTGIGDILIKIFALICWILFIFMMQHFDRIPLFSFSAFAVLFLTASFMCSSIFPFLSTSFQLLCLSALAVITINSFLFKNRGIFCLGPAFTFFCAYIIGYLGYYLASTGNGISLPIFVLYELFEILLMGITLLLSRKKQKSNRLFLIEKVFTSGINPGFAIKKVFYTHFFLALLGLLCVYVISKNINILNINNLVFMYGCATVLLFNTYLTFISWDKPKAEFKNLFKDIKKELSKTKNEINKALHKKK